MLTAILRLHCTDEPGIVHEVTRFVLSNGGNIVKVNQCIDHLDKIFFMRVEWDLSEFAIPRDSIGEYFHTLVAKKYDACFELDFSDRVHKLAVFVTKSTHCLFDVVQRCMNGEWPAEISVIISNHAHMKQYADMFGIPFHHFEITKENKQEQEQQEMKLLDELGVDYILLAKYMQILSPKFVDHFQHRIINIHHSFLPSFKGANPYKAAYLKGVKIIGATAHYVTSDLDEGPIIDQDVRRINSNESVKDLIRNGRNIEKLVFSKGIGLVLNHSVIIHKNRTMLLE